MTSISFYFSDGGLDFLLPLSDGTWNPVHFSDLIKDGTTNSKACISFKLNILHKIKLINGIYKSENAISDKIVIFDVKSEIHAKSSGYKLDKRSILQYELLSQFPGFGITIFCP